MRCIAPLLFIIVAGSLAGTVRAEPDRTEALAKAKTKFELAISKAEDTLLATIDKTLTKVQAAGNKSDAEKLAYERELFVSQRIIPTSVATAAYLKQRSQAVTALEAAYVPVIKALAKAKKDDEVEALESALSDLLKTARGYGLAVPDLGSRPPLLIENKATGQVIEASGKDGQGELVLAAKVGVRKPTQCWHIDRDEKGYTIQNVQGGRSMHIVNKTTDNGLTPFVMTLKLDPKKEIPDRSLFQLSENRREVAILSSIKGGLNGYAITTVEKKQKGVTVYELTLDKKESPPTPNQIWVLSEAK